MKIAIIAIIALLGGAFAQDYGESDVVDADPAEVMQVRTSWPQNDDSNAGALIDFAVSDVEDGSCTANLPGAVRLFHVTNGHIVSGDSTSPIEGIYKIAAPAEWEAINGTLTVLIEFNRDDIFNLTDIEFSCDATDVENLSIYSFPQNDLMKEASSNVFKRDGYHQGDVLTITLPSQVARFNITGGDSELVVDGEGTTYTISGFKNEEGIDDHTEVHFSLDYLPEPENWFSAGDVSVSVTEEEEVEETPVL